MLTNRSYPTPDVSAIFAKDVYDWTTVSTLSSMPSGGSVSVAGLTMLYDSTGKLTYAPNNLVLQSQTLNVSPWDAATFPVSLTSGQADPVGGTAAFKVTPTTANNAHILTQSVAYVGGANYVISGYFKASGYTLIRFGSTSDGRGADVDLAAGTASAWGSATVTITPVSGQAGWYRVSAAFSAASTANKLTGFYVKDAGGNLTFAGDGTSGVLAYGIQLEAVTYQTTPSTYVATTSAAYYGPRFDYDPSTLAAKGLLIEGTRTNLCVYSQTTSDATWTVTAGAKTSTNNADPFGTTSAMLFTAVGTAAHFITAGSVSYTSGLLYCVSCFVKAGTTSLAQLTFNTAPFGSTLYANFSLSGAGSVTASSGGTGFITRLSDGWYRIAFAAPATATASSAAGVLALIASSTDARLPSFASTDTLYVTGWQVEQAAFPSSYIPTVASSVTRAAETFAITGYSSNLINATYIDEQTGVTSVQPYNAGVAPSPSFSWLTALRVYQNAYAGNIATPSWLSFSRTGNAMVTDSTGKLTYAPANILTYSQDFTNAAWTKRGVTTSTGVLAPDGTNTAIKIAEDTSNGLHDIYRSQAMSDGVAYIWSIYAKADDRSWIWIDANDAVASKSWVNLSTGVVGTVASGVTISVTSVGSGWYRISARKAIAGVGTKYFDVGVATGDNASVYVGTTGLGVYVWGAQFEAVTYETQPGAYIPTTTAAVYGPRYDFDASTTPATPRGLLIEESRANDATYSQDFSNVAWNGGGFRALQITTSAGTAPDGTNTANKCVEATAATGSISQRVYQYRATAGAKAFSVYAKAAERRRIYLFVSGPNQGGWFDLVSGTSGAATDYTGGTTSISYVGNGWYRCTLLTNTITATAIQFIVITDAATTVDVRVGDGVSGLYVWGAQLEAGSFATSYIPTTSASVTRAADVAQLTGSALTTVQAQSASVIAETKTFGTTGFAFASDDGNAALYNTQIVMLNTYGRVTNGGVVQATATWSPTLTLGNTNRMALAYAPANFAGVANNGTVATTSSGTVPSTITQAWIGRGRDGAALNGWARSLAFYNQRLPDAILKSKSAVNAPY